jgi:hypothetical protein
MDFSHDRIPDTPDAIDRWHATIDALEAIVLAQGDDPTSVSKADPTEADEVRRLIMFRLAARRRSTLPASWVRRTGSISLLPTPQAEPTPEVNGRAPEPSARPWPSWRE